MSADEDGDQVEIEIPAVTAPTFPIERMIWNSETFYQRDIAGNMIVKLVPLINTQRGNVPHAEALCIVYSPAGWERFQREVAADGVKAPTIETTQHFPGGFLNGGQDS